MLYYSDASSVFLKGRPKSGENVYEGIGFFESVLGICHSSIAEWWPAYSYRSDASLKGISLCDFCMLTVQMEQLLTDLRGSGVHQYFIHFPA